MTNQPTLVTRAAVSIASNIAEGYERGSNKEFRRFLTIASGSAAELRTQLYIAYSIDLIDQKQMAKLVAETKEIAAMLQGLARSRPDSDANKEEQAVYEVALKPEPCNLKP